MATWQNWHETLTNTRTNSGHQRAWTSFWKTNR